MSPLDLLIGFDLDLSLPTDGELQGRAGADPWRERDRLMIGRPDLITIGAGGYRGAGGDLDESYRLSDAAQQLVGANYTESSAPVYGPDLPWAALPPDFPDVGTRLDGIGTRLVAVSDELTSRATTAGGDVSGLVDRLAAQRVSWDNEWRAAENVLGLIPLDSIGPLLTWPPDRAEAGMPTGIESVTYQRRDLTSFHVLVSLPEGRELDLDVGLVTFDSGVAPLEGPHAARGMVLLR